MAEKPAPRTLLIVTASAIPAQSPRRGERAARVRDLLREQILADRYAGRPLPSEHDLMLEYMASRGQIREALNQLREEGFVQRRQGAGTFVVNSKARHRFDRVHGVGDSFRQRPKVRGVLLSVSRVPAPGPVAEVLRLDSGRPCAYVEFRTYVDGAPFNVNNSYLPESIAKVLTPGIFEGDFYEFLEAHGLAVVSGDLMVEAINADELTAAALGIPCGTAVMLFRRVLFSAGDVPVELGFCRCRADRLALAVKLPRRREESLWLAS
jgi:GntR family transcriptional regulator